jgi:hypothetical protein
LLIDYESAIYLEAGLLSLLVGFSTVYPLGDKRIGIIFIIFIAILFVAKYSVSKNLKSSKAMSNVKN